MAVVEQDFAAIREATRRKVATAFIRRRPLLTLPMGTVASVLLYLAGYPRGRIAVILGVYLTYFTLQMVDVWRFRGAHSLPLRTMFTSNLFTFTFVALNVSITGGLRGPLAVSMLPVFLGTLMAFGRAPESKFTLGWVSVSVVLVAVAPPAWTGPVPAAPYFQAITTIGVLLGMNVFYHAFNSLNDQLGEVEGKLDRMREHVIAETKAHARDLETLGAKVAHELKNPLASVKGLVQLLRRGATDERAAERLAVIGGEVERMEAILRDYLSFSRPLENLKPEPIDLGRVVDDTLAVVEARVAEAAITLRREGATSVPVRGDPRRLKEALLNLVGNALEATPRGGSIAVRVEAAADVASVSIADSGPGMSEETLARLGTPFFTTRDGGTGLGVCLARSVIGQHGGTLDYESEPGRGTTATLRVPRLG